MGLKSVAICIVLLCAFVVGLAVELLIAGVNIVYWTFAARGLWLILWTAIAFAALLAANWIASIVSFSTHECGSLLN